MIINDLFIIHLLVTSIKILKMFSIPNNLLETKLNLRVTSYVTVRAHMCPCSWDSNARVCFVDDLIIHLIHRFISFSL